MVEKQYKSQNDAKQKLSKSTGSATRASSKNKTQQKPLDAINEMQEYLETSKRAFEELKNQFPDTLLEEAEKNVPAMNEMREQLIRLARDGFNIMQRFRQIITDDQAKNETERMLEAKIEEYNNCFIVDKEKLKRLLDEDFERKKLKLQRAQ